MKGKPEELLENLESLISSKYEVLNIKKVPKVFTTAEGALIIKDKDGVEYMLSLTKSVRNESPPGTTKKLVKTDYINKNKEENEMLYSKILYSNQIASLMSTVIIDGVCVKHRGGAREITPEEIERRKDNFENIGIQKGRKISVFCSDNVLKEFEEIINSDRNGFYLKKPLEEGLLEVYSKNHKLTV